MTDEETRVEAGIRTIIRLQERVGICVDRDHAKAGWIAMSHSEQSNTFSCYHALFHECPYGPEGGKILQLSQSL